MSWRRALQFVGGLGPRKAEHLLRVFRARKNASMMEARWQLVKKAEMGSVVYMNCAAFIRISPTRVADKSDIYVEVLRLLSLIKHIHSTIIR